VLGISLSSVGGRADLDIGRLTSRWGIRVTTTALPLACVVPAGHMSSSEPSAVEGRRYQQNTPEHFPAMWLGGSCWAGSLVRPLFENPGRVGLSARPWHDVKLPALNRLELVGTSPVFSRTTNE